MRQGTEHTAPTSFSCTITCMIMLIIVNRIQFLYYSSYYKVFKVNNLFFSLITGLTATVSKFRLHLFVVFFVIG